MVTIQASFANAAEIFNCLPRGSIRAGSVLNISYLRKTLRRSGAKKEAQAAAHMVSAFATRQRLVLGQVEVADKSNEIVAIPKLLELLAIERVDASLDGADIRLRIEGLTKLVEDLRAIKPESRRAA